MQLPKNLLKKFVITKIPPSSRAHGSWYINGMEKSIKPIATRFNVMLALRGDVDYRPTDIQLADLVKKMYPIDDKASQEQKREIEQKRFRTLEKLKVLRDQNREKHRIKNFIEKPAGRKGIFPQPIDLMKLDENGNIVPGYDPDVYLLNYDPSGNNLLQLTLEKTGASYPFDDNYILNEMREKDYVPARRRTAKNLVSYIPKNDQDPYRNNIDKYQEIQRQAQNARENNQLQLPGSHYDYFTTLETMPAGNNKRAEVFKTIVSRDVDNDIGLPQGREQINLNDILRDKMNLGLARLQQKHNIIEQRKHHLDNLIKKVFGIGAGELLRLLNQPGTFNDVTRQTIQNKLNELLHEANLNIQDLIVTPPSSEISEISNSININGSNNHVTPSSPTPTSLRMSTPPSSSSSGPSSFPSGELNAAFNNIRTNTPQSTIQQFHTPSNREDNIGDGTLTFRPFNEEDLINIFGLTTPNNFNFTSALDFNNNNNDISFNDNQQSIPPQINIEPPPPILTRQPTPSPIRIYTPESYHTPAYLALPSTIHSSLTPPETATPSPSNTVWRPMINNIANTPTTPQVPSETILTAVTQQNPNDNFFNMDIVTRNLQNNNNYNYNIIPQLTTQERAERAERERQREQELHRITRQREYSANIKQNLKNFKETYEPLGKPYFMKLPKMSSLLKIYKYSSYDHDIFVILRGLVDLNKLWIDEFKKEVFYMEEALLQRKNWLYNVGYFLTTFGTITKRHDTLKLIFKDIVEFLGYIFYILCVDPGVYEGNRQDFKTLFMENFILESRGSITDLQQVIEKYVIQSNDMSFELGMGYVIYLLIIYIGFKDLITDGAVQISRERKIRCSDQISTHSVFIRLIETLLPVVGNNNNITNLNNHIEALLNYVIENTVNHNNVNINHEIPNISELSSVSSSHSNNDNNDNNNSNTAPTVRAKTTGTRGPSRLGQRIQNIYANKATPREEQEIMENVKQTVEANYKNYSMSKLAEIMPIELLTEYIKMTGLRMFENALVIKKRNLEKNVKVLRDFRKLSSREMDYVYNHTRVQSIKNNYQKYRAIAVRLEGMKTKDIKRIYNVLPDIEKEIAAQVLKYKDTRRIFRDVRKFIHREKKDVVRRRNKQV